MVPLKTNSPKQNKVFINFCTTNLGSNYVRYFVDVSKSAGRLKKGVVSL